MSPDKLAMAQKAIEAVNSLATAHEAARKAEGRISKKERKPYPANRKSSRGGMFSREKQRRNMVQKDVTKEFLARLVYGVQVLHCCKKYGLNKLPDSVHREEILRCWSPQNGGPRKFILELFRLSDEGHVLRYPFCKNCVRDYFGIQQRTFFNYMQEVRCGRYDGANMRIQSSASAIKERSLRVIHFLGKWITGNADSMPHEEKWILPLQQKVDL